MCVEEDFFPPLPQTKIIKVEIKSLTNFMYTLIYKTAVYFTTSLDFLGFFLRGGKLNSRKPMTLS